MAIPANMTMVFREIRDVGRLMKSALRASDLEGFLNAVEHRGQLIGAAERLRTAFQGELSQEVVDLREQILSDEIEIKSLHAIAIERVQQEQRKTRIDINKLKAPIKVMQKYGIGPSSGGRLDTKK